MNDLKAAATTAVNLGSIQMLEDEYVYFEIEGRKYEVVTLIGHEKISELFRFELTLDDEATSGLTPFQLLGQSCIMTLHDGFGTRVTLQGIVAEAERMIRDEGTVELVVVMRPNIYPLTLSRDSRVFQHMTVPQIVDRVVTKMKVLPPYRWELTRDYRERVYTAQYREDDWVFINRLLEEEGIYYWFDHEGADSVIVFSDDSTSSPRLTGGAPIKFAFDTGMLGKKEFIHELAAEAHATATKFTVGSFDPWNPALKVMATEGKGTHEHYDAPGGGPEAPEHCHHIAKNRYECAMSHRHSVSGNSSSVRLDPGRILDVFDHPLHDGAYFITEVSYTVVQRRRFSGAESNSGFMCHFEAIPAATTYRPPEDTPVSKQAGFQSGRVVGPPGEEIHTDERGRVRVQLHWDREGGWDDSAGKWMRVAQRGVGMSMLYPRIGWNVMTFMEEGDVSAPTILTRVHDAEHEPTYPLPENKTKTVFRTQTSPADGSANEIRMEDLAGLQELFINASGLMNYFVEQDMTETVGRNHEKKVSGNQEYDIETVMQKDIKNDQTTKVGSNEKLTIVDNRDKQVQGNEVDDIGSDRKLKIGSNITYAVVKDRTLKVTGDVNEEAVKGLIKLAAGNEGSVTITGKATHTLTGIYQEQTTGIVKKDITGKLTEECKEMITVEANDNFTETITKNLSMDSGKFWMDSADNQNHWTVGKAITGTTDMQFNAKAKSKITIRVGSSSIEITPEDITIRSPSYDLGGSTDTVAVTKQIKHN